MLTTTLLLATAMTVRGLTATTGKPFEYKFSHKVSECVVMIPQKAHSKASKKLPDGLSMDANSKITGTVTAGEGLYQFGVSCKERKFRVSIKVTEPEE